MIRKVVRRFFNDRHVHATLTGFPEAVAAAPSMSFLY